MDAAKNVTEDPLGPYYFEHEPEIICGIPVPPITDDYVENYPSVVDRFFTRYYYIKPGAEAVVYKVLFHTNRICLICLPSEHPALKVGVSSLSYDVGNMDRSKNVVRGKGKKGGMPLQPDSTLALLTTVEGKVYKIPSCVRGKLIEVNEYLVNEPKRLESAPEGEGYIAIVLPKPENCDDIKKSLLTSEQYKEYLETGLIKGKSDTTGNQTTKVLETEKLEGANETTDSKTNKNTETEILEDDVVKNQTDIEMKSVEEKGMESTKS